jgi:hypothetical protein
MTNPSHVEKHDHRCRRVDFTLRLTQYAKEMCRPEFDGSFAHTRSSVVTVHRGRMRFGQVEPTRRPIRIGEPGDDPIQRRPRSDGLLLQQGFLPDDLRRLDVRELLPCGQRAFESSTLSEQDQLARGEGSVPRRDRKWP